MALKDALSTVLNRNAFYRDGYRLMLRISILQGVALVLLLVTFVSLILMMETRYIYFATTSDGRIINIVPLNESYRTRAEVIAWAAKTAKNTMQMGYFDYRQRLQQAATNFTPAGWESFTKALKDSRILEAVEGRKLIVQMDVLAAPEVESTLVKNGVYTWYLKFPAQIRFEGAEAPRPMSVMILMQVVRVSVLQNADGISVEQWVTKEVGR